MTLREPLTLREQVGTLLESLRGDMTRAAFARELGMTRQAVMSLEEGKVSLERLETLEAVYGVQFRLVAIDAHHDAGEVTRSRRLADLVAQPPPR